MREKTDRSGNLKEALQVKLKFWLQGPDNFTLGKGDVKLLKALLEHKNLTKASEELHYSYKYGWSKLKKIAKTTGKEVAHSNKGGPGGGGGVELTEWGKYLVTIYDLINDEIASFTKSMNAKLHSLSE